MNYSTATAFTSSGDVVGSVWNDKGNAQGGVWSQKTKTFTALAPPQGCTQTVASGVAGEMIVGSSRNNSGEIFVPTLWKDGIPTTLPLPQNHIGLATGGNIKRAVIGEIFDGKKLSGVVWQGGKMQILNSLDSVWTLPQAINIKGEIVGYAIHDKNYHAFYWSSASSKPVDLSPNADMAFAFAMNSRAQVVGFMGKNNPVATLWQNGKATNLNTLLPKNSGWVLITAKAISEDGKIIVGIGEYKGKALAYRLKL
jgi:uncharacterized membrane protein